MMGLNRLSFLCLFLLQAWSVQAAGCSADSLFSKWRKENRRLEMTFNANKSHFFIPFAAYQGFKFGRSQWLSLGPGFRITQILVLAGPTAAELMEDEGKNASVTGIYNIPDPGNLNSLSLFNLAFFAEARLYKKAGIGMNIDVAGLGLDFTQLIKNGNFYVPGKNLLLGPNLDKGYLISDFYIFFPLSKLADLRVGISHINSPYVNSAGKRRVNYSDVPFIGLRFPL
jgi:hypothetical protein